MKKSRVTIGRKFYFLTAVPLLIGTWVFVSVLSGNLRTIPEGFTQVVVPGRHDITITNPGTYTVFYEYRSVVGSTLYATSQGIPGITCAVYRTDTDTRIPLTRTTVDSKYSMGPRQGVAILEFVVEEPGVYQFQARYNDAQGPDLVFAIGTGFLGQLLVTLFCAMGILFGAIGISLLIAVITFFLRNRRQEPPIMSSSSEASSEE